jgi:hypothetical protein
MLARTATKLLVTMAVLVLAGSAMAQDNLHKYFNDAAGKVKATTNPVEKREILNKSLHTMSQAMDRVESLGLVSKGDRAGMNAFKASLQEKQDELAGRNGYERVPDAQLNAFSDFVVQDMEQADQMITISLVAALVIVIIIILLVR